MRPNSHLNPLCFLRGIIQASTEKLIQDQKVIALQASFDKAQRHMMAIATLFMVCLPTILVWDLVIVLVWQFLVVPRRWLSRYRFS
jgi:hypothetical protein